MAFKRGSARLAEWFVTVCIAKNQIYTSIKLTLSIKLLHVVSCSKVDWTKSEMKSVSTPKPKQKQDPNIVSRGRGGWSLEESKLKFGILWRASPPQCSCHSHRGPAQIWIYAAAAQPHLQILEMIACHSHKIQILLCNFDHLYQKMIVFRLI